MRNEYISVAEFAARAGVSKQSVYQRINGNLQKYVKKIQGKKCINTAALTDIYGIQIEQDLNNENQGFRMSETMNSIVELLRQELRAKDQQIAEKDRQIEALQRTIEQNQQLLDQEQKLHAATSQRLLAAEAPSAPDAEDSKRHWWQWRRP